MTESFTKPKCTLVPRKRAGEGSIWAWRGVISPACAELPNGNMQTRGKVMNLRTVSKKAQRCFIEAPSLNGIR